MHQFPRHSAENEHVLSNEWNNSSVDNVTGGVQSPGRVSGEMKGGRQRTASLCSLHFSISFPNTWVGSFYHIVILFGKLNLCHSLYLKSLGHSSKNLQYENLTMQQWK